MFRSGRLYCTTNTKDTDEKCPALHITFPLQVFAVNSAYKGLAMPENRDESKASKNFFFKNLVYGDFTELPLKRKCSISR